jgi:hypothetical protein
MFETIGNTDVEHDANNTSANGQYCLLTAEDSSDDL